MFLTQVLPYPLDCGPKVRAYHMLCHLARSHRVTLVSFVRPTDTGGAVEHLAKVCHAVHPVPMRRAWWRNVRAALKGLASGLPITIARDEIGEMRATLAHLTRRTVFDVVHADQLSMAGYGQLAAHLCGARRPRTLLDEHNAVYTLVQRMTDTEPGRVRRAITAREGQAFRRYEAAMCREYDALLAVTEQDRDRLVALFPPGSRTQCMHKFTVVPICVDPAEAPVVPSREDEAPAILHLGTMFWPPNIAGVLWFAQEVLPLIHQRLPETRFLVVGKDPPYAVRELAADPRIEVTGYAADPAPYLERAGAFVVPLQAGGGMRVKILDAWLWGLPVVSTPIGAEGIQLRAGENILIAGDACSFAEATVRVLTDAELNRRLRANGRAWVEDHYAWPVVYRQVDEVYARLLAVDKGETSLSMPRRECVLAP